MIVSTLPVLNDALTGGMTRRDWSTISVRYPTRRNRTDVLPHRNGAGSADEGERATGSQKWLKRHSYIYLRIAYLCRISR